MEELTGMSRPTILCGIRELKGGNLPEDRMRKPGGGSKPLEKNDPGLTKTLKKIMAEKHGWRSHGSATMDAQINH
jgi:hypothetical protein